MITGAPSSGKSTTMTELARVFGSQIVTVPESALVLLSGGFPAPAHNDMDQIRAFQKAILQVQVSIEEVISKQYPTTNTMIFDRGALDGAGFWPMGPEAFLAEFDIDVEKEFAHYQFVLFFELPPRTAFGGTSSFRFHDYEQSLESEKQLKKIWGRHPHFIEIKATEIFDNKIKAATTVVKTILSSHLI